MHLNSGEALNHRAHFQGLVFMANAVQRATSWQANGLTYGELTEEIVLEDWQELSTANQNAWQPWFTAFLPICQNEIQGLFKDHMKDI